MSTKRGFIAGCLAIALAACAGQQAPDEEPADQPRAEPTQQEEEEQRETEREDRTEREEPTEEEIEEFGQVDFETSCNEAAQSHFERGLARLHHMWYQKAREDFEEAAEADQECAMAHWGLAMTYYTPLWESPTDEDLEAGALAAEEAARLEAPTQRERDFIAAVEAFYRDYEERDLETGTERFRDAWEEAHQRDPDDIEAASFYALSILATAPAMADEYDEREQAGAILEEVLESEPEHPAGHHYLIHAYDVPPLADRAVEVARSYADIAPSVPHALHMPSHIFTRLGEWGDNVEWNLRSADAAAENPVDGRTSLHFYHALDYVVYSYLQQAEDQKAAEAAERARNADDPQPRAASAYASAAIPARMAIEQRQWRTASEVEPLHPEQLDWENWPYYEGLIHVTRALGAIHEEDLDTAESELETLEELRDETEQMQQSYWTSQLDIYRDALEAMLDQASERPDQALAKMRQASNAQDELEKHPIQPGRILEVDELLGEMLLEHERPDQALQVYQSALDTTPNRFHALYGAATAATRADRSQLASDYYGRLLDLAGEGDPRPEIEEAREYLQRAETSESEESKEADTDG